MVGIFSLWLPILLSAVAAFFVSFLVHMLFKYHTTDYPAVPNQDAVMDALRPFKIAPGDYMMPRCKEMKDMKTPEFEAKMDKGPVVWMTVLPNGQMGMGKYMTQWFIYCIVVSIFAAYVAGQALGADAPFLRVMQFAGTTAFAAYALAHWQNSIWYRRKWSTTIKMNVDGLLLALATGAIFAALWPKS
jgi:hypothetical protein